MSQSDLLDQESVFQLKGSMLAITILELARNDLVALDQQLAAKVEQAPAFFNDAPLIVALDKLKDNVNELDVGALIALCRKHGLRTLAIRTTDAPTIARCALLDIPVLPASGAREKPIEIAPPPPPAPVKPAEPEVRMTKVITTPVRSGQQIYAAGGDLIVLAPVSAGAELLADGHIHVYAPMRGRALAGVKGNGAARIFCQQLGAELLSIAGHYRVSEDLRRERCWGQAVQVTLSGDVLNITGL